MHLPQWPERRGGSTARQRIAAADKFIQLCIQGRDPRALAHHKGSDWYRHNKWHKDGGGESDGSNRTCMIVMVKDPATETAAIASTNKTSRHV